MTKGKGGRIENRIYGRQWRKVRAEVLERDNYECQIRRRGCAGRADRVDHIVPVDQGGQWYAISNLRASCRVCNAAEARALPKSRPSRNWFAGRNRGDRRPDPEVAPEPEPAPEPDWMDEDDPRWKPIGSEEWE